MKVQRLDDYRWRLPRQGQMRVDGLVFASETMMQTMRADQSLQQVANVAHLPGIVGHSIAMPDMHWGYGFPIGGVAAFDADDGVISPGGIGYDINCGVRLLGSGLSRADLEGHTRDLVEGLFLHIPSGVGSQRKDLKLSQPELRRVLERGAAWAVAQGYGTARDLEHSEENGCLQGAQPEAVSARALGGFGYQVCDDALQIMQKATAKYGIAIPDRQLCCAPLSSPEAQEYIGAMYSAANFAFANRQLITHRVRETFEDVLQRAPRDVRIEVIYDVCHNIGKFETHTVHGQARRLCVHRKGATRALPPDHPQIPAVYRHLGQPVLVPGDMGRYSYVLIGTQQGGAETFASSCHVVPNTRPRLVFWACHSRGPHRMECDRAGTRQQVRRRLHGARRRATFPECACLPFHAIDLACLARRYPFHTLGEDPRSLAGLQEEMDMIGHQTQRVDLHTVVGLPHLEGVQVIGVVVVPCEDDLSVMTTLDDKADGPACGVIDITRSHPAPAH